MVLNIGEMMNTKLDLDEMLAGMQRWIAIESPTDSPEGMARMASQVQSDYESFGARVERIPGRDGFGDHVLVTDDRHCPPEAASGSGILLLIRFIQSGLWRVLIRSASRAIGCMARVQRT